ncbi:MAG: glycosyltransferase family 4 protein [Deltaproteobacteria bacterium]|nr:glycosyltransferase family 4 protein [Deltaproteobacteria bacterium]
MRILWICGSRTIGGAERATLEIARSLHARGHSLEALVPRGSPVLAALAQAGLPAVATALGGAWNVRSLWSIAQAYGRCNPQVVLVTTVDEWVWACLAKRRCPEPRLVLARHMALPLTRLVAGLAVRRADVIVAVSQAVCSSLEDSGVGPQLVRVIANPCRFAARATLPSAEERRQARRALGLNPTGHWVAFFGGLRTAKGIDDVIGAVCRANAEVGPTHLLAAGASSARDHERVLDDVKQLGLADRFLYLGETERVAEAMTAADVVVMATRRCLSEAFGLTLLEAMACGTPVLAYSVGGIPEVLGESGEWGRLVPPDDAAALAQGLVRLLADSTAAAGVAAKALLRVHDSFQPAVAADRYEQLFRALAG